MKRREFFKRYACVIASYPLRRIDIPDGNASTSVDERTIRPLAQVEKRKDEHASRFPYGSGEGSDFDDDK